MRVHLQQMSVSSGISRDQGIFDEIQQSHRYCVFVQHRGRWLPGCRFASFEQARQTAGLAFRRSTLPVEVRDHDGTLLFELRPGIEVESLLADFQTESRR